MAKTGPTPRRMRRGNPQAIRAPARGPRRTVIITTTPDDFTAGTADITTAGTTAGNLRRFIDDRLMPHRFLLRCKSPLLAQSRHSTTEFQCPLLTQGGHGKSLFHCHGMTEFLF